MLDKFFNAIERFVPLKWRWILGHGGFRRYFTNTGWMFFGQAFNLFISFFIGIWIIRYLGPKNYGIFSYTLAFVGLFSFIASLGIDNILQRELVNHPERKNELMGTAFRLKLFGGSVALLFSVIFISLTNNSLLIKFLVSIYSFIFLLQSVNIINIFFNSRVESKKGVQAQVLAASISAILKITLIFFGLGVIWLTIIYILDSLWISLFLISSYRRSNFKLKEWRFDSCLAKKMLSNSWLLALTSVSILIYMKIDQIMIKQIINETAVGLYAASVRLFELTYVAPSVLITSLSPAIFNARKKNINSYYYRLKKISILLFLFSFFIAIIISLFSGFIVRVLLGDEYVGSILVLSIGVWSILGISLTYIVSQYLIAENYINIYFFITLFGALINIILNYLLIPFYGINGAAMATVFSYLIVPMSLFFFKKTRKDLKVIFRSNIN